MGLSGSADSRGNVCQSLNKYEKLLSFYVFQYCVFFIRKIQAHDTKIGYLWVCLVVHGCKISFSKPTGHYLHKNMTYVLFLIIIIQKAIRLESGNDWSLAFSIQSKCIPRS